MPGKFIIPAGVIICWLLLSTGITTALGQESNLSIGKNNLKMSDQTHQLEMPAPPTLPIFELDAEKMRTLTRRGGRQQRRPLLLYLWYTDCQPCRTAFTDVERLARAYQGRGLEVVTVAVAPMDNRDKLLQYFSAQPLPPQVPVYLLKELGEELSDDVFQKDWEVTVPATFGYDAKGQVVLIHTAIESDYYSVLKKAAEQLLSQHQQPH